MSKYTTILLLSIILISIFFTVGNALQLKYGADCADVNSETCQLSWSLEQPVAQRTAIELISSQPWASGIQRIVRQNDIAQCSINSKGLLQVTFNSKQQAVVCSIVKKSNIIIPYQIVSTDNANGALNVKLPFYSYLPAGLQLLTPPNEYGSTCANSIETNCLAQFQIPQVLENKKLIVDSTSELNWQCPQQVITSTTPTRVYKKVNTEFGTYHVDVDNGNEEAEFSGDNNNNDGEDLTFEVNRYILTVGTLDNINDIWSCQVNITKSLVSPYFKVYLTNTDNNNDGNGNNNNENLILIYTSTNILRSEITITSGTNCRDVTSPLCTIYYNNIPIQHDFIGNVEFFTQVYDHTPVLDQSYIPQGQERRYMQRYIKQVAMDSTLYNNDNPQWSNVYLYSPLLEKLTFRIAVQQFVYSSPLQFSYDEDVCADPYTSICPFIITSKFVGRPISITLSRLPLSGIIDNIQCSGGMFIDEKRPTEVYFISPNAVTQLSTTALSNPPLTMVDGLADIIDGDVGFKCIINFAIPFDGNPFNNPSNVPQLSIIAVTSYFPIKQYTTLNIPVPELQREDVVFNMLPFTLEPHQDDLLQHEPTTGYKLRISLNNEQIWGNLTTSAESIEENYEEIQDIMNRVVLRSFSLPIYNLREPQFDWGQDISGVLNITVSNSNLLLVSIDNVDFTSATLGYDIVHVSVSTYYNLVDFNQMFVKDKLTGEYQDIIIDIRYWQKYPTTEEVYDDTRYDKIYNIKLLKYNGVEQTIAPPIVYTSQPGEFYWTPLITMTIDKSTCNNRRKAFCPLNARIYTKVGRMTGPSVEILADVLLHSILIAIPADSIIDGSRDYSTPGLDFNVITPRIDPITGELASTLYINVTLPNYKDQGIDISSGYYDFDLYFIKRLGVVNTWTKIVAPTFMFVKSFYLPAPEGTLPEDRELIAALFMDTTVEFFYVLTYVNYAGDVTFNFQEETCNDLNSPLCIAEVKIYTNNILPGTTLIQFDATYVLSVFYLNDQVLCEGWEGIPIEESPKYISLPFDPATMTQSGVITSIEDDKFSMTKPLHFDPQKRSYVLCTVPSYKLLNKRNIFTPPIYPKLYIGVDYNDPRYNIYPVSPLVNGLALIYTSIRYNPFDIDYLEDCKTSYLNVIQCTLKFTPYGSQRYPINNVRLVTNQADYRAHGILSVTLTLGDMIYKNTFCQPNNNLIPSQLPQDPGAMFGLSIDDNFIVTMSSSLSINPNDTTKYGAAINRRDPNYFGTYKLSYSVCNTTAPVIIRIELAEKYKTSNGDVSGYLALKGEYVQYEQMSIAIPDSILKPVAAQVLVNVPEILDPNAIYPLQTANPYFIAQTPSRQYLPAMSFGKLFTQSFNTQSRFVTTPTNVTITWTLYTSTITQIIMDTILGDFITKDNYPSCTKPRYNGTGYEERTLGYLSTDWNTEKTILNVNQTLLALLLEEQKSEMIPRQQQYDNDDEMASDNVGIPDIGVECSISIPINSRYPTSFGNVKHETVVSELMDEKFISYWQYPHMQNNAQILIQTQDQIYKNSAYSQYYNYNINYIILTLFIIICTSLL